MKIIKSSLYRSPWDQLQLPKGFGKFLFSCCFLTAFAVAFHDIKPKAADVIEVTKYQFSSGNNCGSATNPAAGAVGNNLKSASNKKH